jgi:hypothetical protein
VSRDAAAKCDNSLHVETKSTAAAAAGVHIYLIEKHSALENAIRNLAIAVIIIITKFIYILRCSALSQIESG